MDSGTGLGRGGQQGGEDKEEEACGPGRREQGDHIWVPQIFLKSSSLESSNFFSPTVCPN